MKLAVVVAAFLQLASAQPGKDLFAKRCAGCHALEIDREGPRLRGVCGRPAAAIPTFEYSEALRKSRIHWTRETLDRWLTDADKVVPGADMPFRVPAADERRALVDFLCSTK
jgi:cytochrome c